MNAPQILRFSIIGFFSCSLRRYGLIWGRIKFDQPLVLRLFCLLTLAETAPRAAAVLVYESDADPL